MDSIHYRIVSKPGAPHNEAVFLGGKIVGAIRGSDQTGYWYKPTRHQRGEVFPTVAEVKGSIEGDE